ncbi:MAG: hypothetical protein HY094_07580 [Candidatus Melainabacteria bacterium]|nr:hypothetical protein [Candidatus Melainabacteria bacterium]
MPETPYCPLLSINKDIPVLCQEELCMWYIKQLKLCSLTVMAYTNALNLQTPAASGTPQAAPLKPQQSQPQVKQNLTNQPKREEVKAPNPFALDDLD